MSQPSSPNERLTALLPATFVAPRYDGRSVANLPTTVGHLLGVTEGWAGAALEPTLLEKLGDGVQRVVLLLVDGLGWNRLQAQLPRDDAGFQDVLDRYAVLNAPITSVAPSTTSVATTVLLCNGAAPAETGMLGYSFLLPHSGVVANMLFWYPVGKSQPIYGELEGWGIDPETFLGTLSTAEVLASADIPMRVIMPKAYSDSPLSRMRPRGAALDGFINATDMWFKLGAWLEETAGKKAYAYAYYADFDTLSHRDGCDAPVWEALWRDFNFQLTRFFEGLSARQRDGTLFLITADHGHVVTPPREARFLQDYPGLLEHSLLTPGGEPRHVYLYARAGHKAELLAYARAHLSDAFAVLDGAEALAAGLYGDPARLHPDAARRVGDVVLLAKGAHFLWNKESPTSLLGLHGSLTADEMLVPLIGLRP
ncbi:alkaline phosphatase family protein [soil metagenome]